MRELPFPNNSLDGVWSCQSIPHLQKSEIDSFLDEVSRVLKNDGKFFVSTNIGQGEKHGCIGDLGVKGFRSFYTLDELEELLLKHQFCVLKSEEKHWNNRHYAICFCRCNKS